MFIHPKKIVVIGGGTGTHTVLSGLKKLPPHAVSITAIVSMADSGGSTGRLRDEFGYLPVGDVRMALVGLADENATSLLRELFMYRFDKGEGLSGHNFGNLLLVALTDILGSEEAAIEEAGRILRLHGRVVPVTPDDTTLVARYEDGSIVRGETHIDEPHEGHDGRMRIVELSLAAKAHISQKAHKAIAEADIIVLAPGDLYTSLLANMVIEGMPEVIAGASGKLVYIMNLMTKYGQTLGLTARGHLDEVVKYIGREPDEILVNNTPLPSDILAKYVEEHDQPVEDDFGDNTSVRRMDLLASQEVKKEKGDTLKRSLIRHDPDKLAEAIFTI